MSIAAQVVKKTLLSRGVILGNDYASAISRWLMGLPVVCDQRFPSDPSPIVSTCVWQPDEPFVTSWVLKILNFLLDESPFAFSFKNNKMPPIFDALIFCVGPFFGWIVVKVEQNVFMHSWDCKRNDTLEDANYSGSSLALDRRAAKCQTWNRCFQVSRNSPLSHGGHIVPGTKNISLFYHAKPHRHGFHCEA